ncbi:MAG: GNAT family N-acetyltransferase [Rickettsiales bacterium]|nr:GNAT family N-acetyltransferase [Rickettsiales bacterium]
MDFHIRAPVVNDAPVIQNLLDELGYKITEEQITDKIQKLDEQKSYQAFVAEMDSRVIGFMSFHIIDWFHQTDCMARLSALVVDKSYRRKGLGNILIQLAETQALQAGCTVMELSSNLRRKTKGTYEFYLAHRYRNMKDQTTYFRKNL